MKSLIGGGEWGVGNSKKSSLTANHYPLITFLALLFTVHYSLITLACNLNVSRTDILDIIDKEVAWAHADKLAVTVVYPQEWGSSPQNGTGKCCDIIRKDQTPRKGYEFSVQFNPNAAYGDAQWRAYKTADLPEGNTWYISTTSITDALAPLADKKLTSAEVVFSPNTGSVSTVKSKISDAITIIPWSEKQPRVIGASPPLNAAEDFRRMANKDITVTFAAPVDRNTLKFNTGTETGFISITGKDADTGASIGNMSTYFVTPFLYDEDTCTLTIQSKGNIPDGLVVTVRLGTGIMSVGGSIGMAKSVVLTYRTMAPNSDTSICSWQAFYDEDQEHIALEWVMPSVAGTLRPVIRCRVNNGYPETKEYDDSQPPIFKATIAAAKPDSTGVRDGRPVSGINSYTITLELGEDQTTIKIWNVPGMKVQQGWNGEGDITVEEIASLADLQAIRNSVNENSNVSKNKNYVLTANIALTGTWIPIGKVGQTFQGKFYGNGKTITVSNLSNAADTGLFGVINGGLVRDLTVVYGNVIVNGAVNVGGIAGEIWGGSSILNCIAKGITGTETLTLTPGICEYANFGGIVGFVNNSFIANCRAGLNVKLNPGGTGTGSVGAVAGYVNSGSGGNIDIKNGYPNPDSSCTLFNLAIDGVTVTAYVSGNTSGADLVIGGAVGCSKDCTMRNIVVSGSTVSFNRTTVSGDTNVGGVTGYAENSSMEACSFAGDASGTIDNNSNDYIIRVYLGGLIGHSKTDSDGDVYINKCRVRGNIEVTADVGEDVGGVFGVSTNKGGSVTITNCFFEEGNITAICSSSSFSLGINTEAGGFCGAFVTDEHFINNCGVLAGTVTIDVEKYAQYIHAGGFVSSFAVSGGTISNCFSRAHVISRGNGNKLADQVNEYDSHGTGGFMGYLAPDSTIRSCYATGTVRSVHNGDRELNTGGLVGNSQGIIENCYALGDVLADHINGPNSYTAAGGLVGTLDLEGVVRYSFSAGQIFAQSKENTSYSGGVVGTRWHGIIKNTAALGGRINSAFGSTTPLPTTTSPYAGRIAGFFDSPTPAALSNNYANYKMLVGTAAYQARITEDVVDKSDTGDGKVHGGDITIGSHNVSQGFWSGTGSGELGFNSTGSYTSAVPPWDFSTVVGKGHPVLKGLGGQ